eukprot:9312320-Pyramimonas_sp.AAC.1
MGAARGRDAVHLRHASRPDDEPLVVRVDHQPQVPCVAAKGDRGATAGPFWFKITSGASGPRSRAAPCASRA